MSEDLECSVQCNPVVYYADFKDKGLCKKNLTNEVHVCAVCLQSIMCISD